VTTAYSKAQEDPHWRAIITKYLAVDPDDLTSAQEAKKQRIEYIDQMYEIERQYELKEEKWQ